jgi:hypothetical protein
MQPQSVFTDPGVATVGTIFGGPYAGPLIDQITGLTFLDVDKNVTLYDAVAGLTTGAAFAQAHAYLVSIGDVQNVIAVIKSTQIPPNSNLRRPPSIKIPAGSRVFIRSVQLSGAQEAGELTLLWAKPAIGGIA